MPYVNAKPLPFRARKEEYTPLDFLYRAICNLSKEYAYDRRGRGPTHEEAYKEGCKKTLELIRSGKFNITLKEG